MSEIIQIEGMKTLYQIVEANGKSWVPLRLYLKPGQEPAVAFTEWRQAEDALDAVEHCYPSRSFGMREIHDQPDLENLKTVWLFDKGVHRL